MLGQGDRRAAFLVWPNGADFDPATLNDWQENVATIWLEAARWEMVGV